MLKLEALEAVGATAHVALQMFFLAQVIFVVNVNIVANFSV